MKFVVLGANGRTGNQVMRRLLNDGASVTAVVRSEAKRPSLQHDRLTVIVGDPCDPKLLTEVFLDQDAVISTLGGRSPTKIATSVYPLSASAIVEAARKTGLKKVVVTSSALLFTPRKFFDRLLASIVPNVVQNATLMEQMLFAADIDITVARCGFLSDGDETRYRTNRDALPEHGSSVSRQSLAHFLVDCVKATWSGNRVYGVSGPLRA